MQFMVIATHTADNCPAYGSGEFRAAVKASSDETEQRARELGIKIHFMVTSAPDHVIYGLIETDSLSSIQQFMLTNPIKQDVRVIPVQPLSSASTNLQSATSQPR